MTKYNTFALTGRHRSLLDTQGVALGYVLPLGFQPALFNALANTIRYKIEHLFTFCKGTTKSISVWSFDY